MAEELGKIEKPKAEDYQAGRKLFFVPLVFSNREMPAAFTEIGDRYWEQVEAQLASLEAKLGNAQHIFHELVPESGEKGLETLNKLKVASLKIVKGHLERGSVLESTEDEEILNELMDWSRCLSIGLQSQKAYTTIYAAYVEATNKRNDAIAKKIDELIKADQAAIVIMGENHHVRFPADARIFYIAPPALDELNRWLRDYEASLKQAESEPPTEEKDPASGS